MIEGFDFNSLEQATGANGPVVRVLVASHAGSSPRETGTAMLVWQDGMSGTIGGGALEFEAIAKARTMLAANTKTTILKMPLGPALGQCCGGAVTLVLERFDRHTLPGFRNTYSPDLCLKMRLRNSLCLSPAPSPTCAISATPAH